MRPVRARNAVEALAGLLLRKKRKWAWRVRPHMGKYSAYRYGVCKERSLHFTAVAYGGIRLRIRLFFGV